jgi:hypothetical protein
MVGVLMMRVISDDYICECFWEKFRHERSNII